MQDWVLYTQNIVCKYYADKILVHGDKELLPLISDRTRLANSVQIIKDIDSLIEYTGYVCDETQPIHKQKNNNIYVSTGLNKDESVVIFTDLGTLKVSDNIHFIDSTIMKHIPAGPFTISSIILSRFTLEKILSEK